MINNIKDYIKIFTETYGKYIEKETLDDAIKEMNKAKDFAQAFNIASLFTNLNFYRYKDTNEIVHSSYANNKRECYFDKKLAQPYLDNILGGK